MSSTQERGNEPTSTRLRGSGGMDYQFRQRVPEHHARSASLKSTYKKILLLQCLLLASSLFIMKISFGNTSLIILLIISVVGNLLSVLIGACGRSNTSSTLMKLNGTIVVALCMFPLILYLFLISIYPYRLKTTGMIVMHSILLLIADMFVAVYSRMMVNCWNKAKEYKYQTSNDKR
ncbi:hypothetical protein LOD99_2299 [Oopsacas minuta]|uniref:MARVEL domain-containing protein n=1 Tax=Oopsacas minuta TaxID=111878 RepID=A0AAV7K2K1_9METZ|nr:hypothetical protein LOD99_2299 [Oopsacas minuta]